MASQHLYLDFLFTMTLLCLCAQAGTDNNEQPAVDLGLSLVPSPHIILVQKKMVAPLLLNCSVNVTDQNLLPLHYNWLKDGQQMDLMHPKSKVQLLPNGSLVLLTRRYKNRNRTLHGVYDCIVTTAASKNAVIARRVKVMVANITRNVSKEVVTKEAYKGGVARFECNIRFESNIRAEPVASYIWHRNDTQLPQDDDRFTSLQSGVLQISNVDLSDAGMYWCQATTYLFTSQEQIANFGWKKGKRAGLRVKADSGPRPPLLLASPQNISVLAGQTAEFECFADGNPLPSVVWKKAGDSKTMLGPQEVSQHGNLRLVQVSPEDAGTYECTVSGHGQTLKASATLTVLEPPKLEQGPESHLYPVSKVVSMSCKVTGNPFPKISWYRNGIPISQTDIYSEAVMNGQTLYLYSLQKKDSGYYQCIAENSVGLVTAVAVLRIVNTIDAPPPPTNVRCTPLSSTSFMVSWDHISNGSHPYVITYQAVGDSKPPLQKFCDPQKNTSRQQCEITNQNPYTNYSLRVQAFTIKGASDISERVYVRTLEDVPQTVPQLTITSPSFHSLLVSWTPLTPEQSRGRVVAYKVYYRSDDKRDETSKEVAGDQTSYLITGLEAEKTYGVLVLAATSVGYPKLEQWSWMKARTSPANASSPPRLVVRYFNATAVHLEWQATLASSTPPADQAITGYSLELRSVNRSSEPVKKIQLEASVQKYLVTGLDYEELYEIKLTALTKQGTSIPSTSNFSMKGLQSELVLENLHATSVQPSSVTLSWNAVPGVNVKYEVCLHKELDKLALQCKTSQETSVTVSDLESFTRYELIVRALMDGIKGADKILIVRTTEDIPSAPVNLTAQVKQNTVQLEWEPPVKPNGLITHYIIMYGRSLVNTDDITWKSITQKGSGTSAQLEDLEPGLYLFKLRAGNKAGHSPDTDVVSAVPLCKTWAAAETSCSLMTETTESVLTDTASDSVISRLTKLQIGIIVSSLIVVVTVVLIWLLMKRFYCRRRNYAREQEVTANHRGNGHVSPVPGHAGNHKPGNGHIHVNSAPGGYRHEAINMHESTPMLKQIPENEHSDSKGGPDIVIMNGFLPNGISKENHKIMEQTNLSIPAGDLKSSNNPEELQGLMSAVLTSVSNRETLNRTVNQKIPMSELDDVDKDDEYLGDNTSQDSGMGGRHPGVLGSKDTLHDGFSPANSPGQSSLGRRHQGLELGRDVDEIGGVFINRSTGAVIAEVTSCSKAVEKEEVDEEAAKRVISDDSLSNDRDSGHGSETKSHGGILNCISDDTDTWLGSNAQALASPDDIQSDELVLPPPPPPPPPLLLHSPALSSSLPSSQQLPSSRSRNQANNNRPQNGHRQHPRIVRQNISHTDLPPPPPSPPLSSPALPPSQHSLAADTATSTAAAAATAELNSSGSSIDAGGQQQLNDGSMLSRQSEGGVVVGFLRTPQPTPSHIAGNVSQTTVT